MNKILLQKTGNNLLMTFIPFLIARTWKAFSITSKIFIKTLSLLWKKKSNGELVILDNLIKME